MQNVLQMVTVYHRNAMIVTIITLDLEMIVKYVITIVIHVINNRIIVHNVLHIYHTE